MKYPWILCLVLAGCQSVTAPIAPQPQVPAVPASMPAPSQREAELEARLQQQRYVVDALLSQQEALRARPGTDEARPPVKPVAAAHLVPLAPVLADSRPANFMQPDGKGVIDLALLAAKPADSAHSNPFVVQTADATPPREIPLLVQGILSGANPSAIVNERPLEIGESVESLRLVRVEADSAYFSAGDQLLRIPLGRPVRVRLP